MLSSSALGRAMFPPYCNLLRNAARAKREMVSTEASATTSLIHCRQHYLGAVGPVGRDLKMRLRGRV
jgi:hypothetical protein